MITWITDPLAAAETSRGPWWYGPLVFLVFLALSILLTFVIVAVDKTDAARHAGDEAERKTLLLRIEADIKTLKDQMAGVQLPKTGAASGASAAPAPSNTPPAVAGKNA